jgi:S-adenosylmethionine decarboxylase
MENTQPLGRHMILEIWGEPGSFPFWNMDEAAAALVKAAKDAGATVLSERWHHFGSGFGYTGVIILSESHISVHTWPEKGYASIDVYMCGSCNPEDCLEAILGFYKPLRHSYQTLKRGLELSH